MKRKRKREEEDDEEENEEENAKENDEEKERKKQKQKKNQRNLCHFSVSLNVIDDLALNEDNGYKILYLQHVMYTQRG